MQKLFDLFIFVVLYYESNSKKRKREMDFLYLFDMINFDASGKIDAGEEGLEKARSNYLYLISKYNQTILQEENLPVSDFFKTELSQVLEDVENGGDYEGAQKKVLSNCHLKTQQIALSSNSEKDFILRLNSAISVRDEAFACLVGKNVNRLQLAYIITSLSGKVEKKIEKSLDEGIKSKNEKSKVFKDMIKYNRLMLTAQKVESHELSAGDLCPVVA